MSKYNWYTVVDGDEPLQQGDFIFSCPYVIPEFGQALAVRAEEQKAEERRQEAARIAAEVEAEEARERQERRRVEEEKNKLPAAERKRLRLRAEQHLKDPSEYKQEYITEALIATTENQILRSEWDNG